jgi:hypothetical protein
MADPTYQYTQNHPHRKPVPRTQPNQQFPASPSSAVFSHSRTRTTSSNIFPTNNNSPHTSGPLQNTLNPYPNNGMYQGTFTSRRTPSTNTFSTTASGNGPLPQRQSASSEQNLRRSTSSIRSGNTAPTSYVALMRKQKATVWCDRSQHEDPRIVAAQRAAKIRAQKEVSGGGFTLSGRTSTGGGSGTMGSSTGRVTAKIRHHGKSALTDFTPGNNLGVGIGGVPMRLSASEVEGGDSDEDRNSEPTMGGGMYHHRSGSGRSSVGSAGARRGLQYRQSGASANSGRWSSGNTPPSERESGLNMTRVDSLTDLAEETPVPAGHTRARDYFEMPENGDGTRSSGSGSSGERADKVGDIGAGGGAARLASNSLLKSTVTREKSTKNPDELRRRGSVDDRTMTMSAGRLFVANPDMDSD